jgi:hypothetical protein
MLANGTELSAGLRLYQYNRKQLIIEILLVIYFPEMVIDLTNSEIRMVLRNFKWNLWTTFFLESAQWTWLSPLSEQKHPDSLDL